MKFRNICPNGARMFPALGDRVVEAGEVVDVPDWFGEGLLGQVDVWEFVAEKAPTKKGDDE